jgi:hypothetical protein
MAVALQPASARIAPGRWVNNLERETAMTATGTTNSKEQNHNGRDARGRFVPGNKGGPGNPFARKVAELRKTLVNFVTEDDMKHIAFILKERAMGGDLAAIKLLLQYLLGKPSETIDPDRLDLDEWQKLQETARPAEEMTTVMNRLPVNTLMDLTKIAWPCQAAKIFADPLRKWTRDMDQRDARREKRRRKKAKWSKRRKPSPSGNGGIGVPEPNEWLERLLAGASAADTGQVGGVPKPDRPIPNGGNGRRG